MVSPLTVTVARLMMAIGIILPIAACSTGQGPSAMAYDPATDTAQIQDRFSDQGLQPSDAGSAVVASTISPEDLEDTRPEHYTVVRGDTLWDISDRFLKEPWRWSELWSYNPKIHNPHLIYPGDVLTLVYLDGKPTLNLTRDGKPLPRSSTDGNDEPGLGAAEPTSRISLSPRVRSESLNDSIPTIPAESIRQFLIRPRVVDAETIANAPYVVASNEMRLISSLGSRILVRGPLRRSQTSYGVFRNSKKLLDPVNGEVLGHELLHIADATLLNVGDPSTLMITSNKMETIEGDIILPFNSTEVTHTFSTRMPELVGSGRIVSLVNAISQSGRNQVVVLNVGQRSNIKEGDVFAIESRGRDIVDKRGLRGWEHVTLPNSRTGVLMVFKAFDKVSYALVMESTRPVMINDIITGI